MRFASFGGSLFITGCLLFAQTAVAAFVSPSGWTRSDASSTYQEWDKFSSPAGPNAPNSPNVPAGAVVDAAPFNPNGAANVIDSSGASFVTSGGNIYSPSAIIDIDVQVPNYNAGAALWTTIILQTRTQGSLLDLNSIRIEHNSNTYTPVEQQLMFQQNLGGFGGVLQDRWFEFHLPGNAASYTIQFAGAESSVSLDKVAVDTIWTAAASPINEPQPVPEPAGLALAITAACSIWFVKHRRKQRI